MPLLVVCMTLAYCKTWGRAANYVDAIRCDGRLPCAIRMQGGNTAPVAVLIAPETQGARDF